MGKPVMVKGMSFGEMLEEVKQKGIEAKKKLEENEGRCIKCNKNMANPKSTISQFHCDECNEKAKKILEELQGQPGFVRARIPI